MAIKDNIIKIARIRKRLKSRDIVNAFKISRQYAFVLINSLVLEGKLLKVGSTNKAFYILPELASQSGIFPNRIIKRFRNKNAHEHEIQENIVEQYSILKKLPENIENIFTYAFSEMLNNAIEHSKSKDIEVEISVMNRKLSFVVNDFGIGVFRNVMKKRKLKNELEAIQDLLKGKTTTMPKSHSGEGIFFTSKAADVFTLESFGYLLIINNQTKDIVVQNPPALKRGTKVKFSIALNSSRHLKEVFQRFESEETDRGFSKTEIKVKLYSTRGIYVSRSQARRLLTNLDKFTNVILDFEDVSMIGQAFADEVFRVFPNKYPHVSIQPINMGEAVKLMVYRAAER